MCWHEICHKMNSGWVEIGGCGRLNPTERVCTDDHWDPWPHCIFYESADSSVWQLDYHINCFDLHLLRVACRHDSNQGCLHTISVHCQVRNQHGGTASRVLPVLVLVLISPSGDISTAVRYWVLIIGILWYWKFNHPIWLSTCLSNQQWPGKLREGFGSILCECWWWRHVAKFVKKDIFLSHSDISICLFHIFPFQNEK